MSKDFEGAGSHRWTQAEIELLREWYPDVGCGWDGWNILLPDLSSVQIASKAHYLGLKARKKHTRKIFKEGA